MSILANALVTFCDGRIKILINLTRLTETWKIEQSQAGLFLPLIRSREPGATCLARCNCGVRTSLNKNQTNKQMAETSPFGNITRPLYRPFLISAGHIQAALGLRYCAVQKRNLQQLFSSCGSQEHRKSNMFSPRGRRRRCLVLLNSDVNGWVDAVAKGGPSSHQPQEWLQAELSAARRPMPGWFGHRTENKKIAASPLTYPRGGGQGTSVTAINRW